MYSPFSAPRTRIATVTAHFGDLEGNEHYTKAFTTQLEHALMIDDLWNKPAFILKLLPREMIKPESKRLEWLVWWWRRNEHARSENPNKPPLEMNLLATNDRNDLSNGIFLLRVSPWAVSVFTTILACRHYNPTLKLKFTEQSAMELVLKDDRFRDQVQFVLQRCFNAYSHSGPKKFVERNDTKEEGVEDVHARRGDWLVRFAGNEHKDEALNGWADMLEGVGDVWDEGRVQMDVTGEARQFWERKGFR
ncbi:glycosyltransferase family 34 protein [Macroventuria anomochaeta]|uniref:Glycosyltransferase family 34 protein n=1 Tax=Macroventuria anomochaeta TaxID=301207 RepID=A0ACB6S1E1_9PLEO|nr:glycosyltransferase family 34 protein [Macroventuria anomochaeta]KAF2627843.1 glycosyltransferase family 34 protein [Macroventuria anomochaeta]